MYTLGVFCILGLSVAASTAGKVKKGRVSVNISDCCSFFSSFVNVYFLSCYPFLLPPEHPTQDGVWGQHGEQGKEQSLSRLPILYLLIRIWSLGFHTVLFLGLLSSKYFWQFYETNELSCNTFTAQKIWIGLLFEKCSYDIKWLCLLPDRQNVAIKHTNLDKTLNSKETNATVKDDQVKTEILES